MINTNSVLSAVQDLQPNAQAALPVIPRNGNPQGANNMPSVPPAAGNTGIVPPPMAAQRRRPEDFYPWLQPSPHMDAFTEMLRAPIYSPMQQPYTAQPVPQTQPAMPSLPILPQVAR